MTTSETVIRAVELLRPKVGDTLILTIDRHTTAEQRRIIAASFKRACPQVEVAVIPDNWKVQVVRKEDVPQPPSLEMGTQRVGLLGADAAEYKPATGPTFEAKDAPIQPHA